MDLPHDACCPRHHVHSAVWIENHLPREGGRRGDRAAAGRGNLQPHARALLRRKLYALFIVIVSFVFPGMLVMLGCCPLLLCVCRVSAVIFLLMIVMAFLRVLSVPLFLVLAVSLFLMIVMALVRVLSVPLLSVLGTLLTAVVL